MSSRSTDECSVIMEIQADSPGDEGARAAAELFRMYEEYAAAQGWRVEVLSSRPVPDAGFREIIASIEGADAFSALRFEAGRHRIQRMIQQEGRDRVRTLLVRIDVLPLPPTTEFQIEDIDLSVTCFRLARPGPGNIDGADSVGRVTHLPTGLKVEQRNQESHYGAVDRAMKILRARVFQNQQEGSIAPVDSDHKRPVRTYNIPQARITDRRIDLNLWDIDDVVSSKALAKIIEALLASPDGPDDN